MVGRVGGWCPGPRTGCPPLSFTAESGGARQSWAAALQEAVTETLSDYEVAEKIWSNRANRHCADCGASRPDWAAVNLGVVICKQCAGKGRGLCLKWGGAWGRRAQGAHALHTLTGQHRALGSGISKVQSLKLDTSVWSNEIVQVRSLQREKVCLGVWAGVEGACVKRPWVQLGDRIGMPGDTSFCHFASALCDPAVVHCPGKRSCQPLLGRVTPPW